MTGGRVLLTSLSAAMDGGFTAVADVSAAMASAGVTEHHRLIGGVAVMLHIRRLGLDLPLRATGDADFGVPPHLLRGPELVDAIEAVGYQRWQATGGSVPSTSAVSRPSICSSRRTDPALVTPSRSGRS